MREIPLLAVGRRIRMRHVLAELTRLPTPRTLLDAGCGDARFAAAAAKLLPKTTITAIEPDPDVRQEAVRRASRHPNLEIHAGAIGDAYPTDAFDCVVCVDVLEHVSDDKTAFDWLARHVAPGGHLLAHVPARPQRHLLASINRAIAVEVAHGRGPHVREGYAPDELRHLVEATGLTVDHVASTFHHPVVRAAEDLDTWLAMHHARLVKALLLPLMLLAAAFERRPGTEPGYGVLALARSTGTPRQSISS